MTTPSIPPPEKPKTGVLKYGNQTIAEDKPFWELAVLQKKLIREGYDENLFHKHYYYGRK